MSSAKSGLHTVTLPRARLRRFSKRLLNLAPSHEKEPSPPKRPIKVVCISDTHNHQPELPPGDLLLHAGDLTEWGSFDEVQKQLAWLSSQSHTHKVIIAGNHDTLFDPVFLDANRDRFPVEPGRTAADLDFGSVIYLQDSSVTLEFPELVRKCKIYGSPWTPKHVPSAFQYERSADVWSETIPEVVNILLTHGPPYGHLDGWRRSGCQFLAQTVERRRPRLVVFGHIHVGYGREMVRFDRLRRSYDEIQRDWSGWEIIPVVIWLLFWAWISKSLTVVFQSSRHEKWTELINAAVVGEDSKLCNEVVVTYV